MGLLLLWKEGTSSSCLVRKPPRLHLPRALWDLSRLAHASLKTVSLQISHQAGWRETLRTAQQGDWVDVPELFHQLFTG